MNLLPNKKAYDESPSSRSKRSEGQKDIHSKKIDSRSQKSGNLYSINSLVLKDVTSYLFLVTQKISPWVTLSNSDENSCPSVDTSIVMISSSEPKIPLFSNEILTSKNIFLIFFLSRKTVKVPQIVSQASSVVSRKLRCQKSSPTKMYFAY